MAGRRRRGPGAVRHDPTVDAWFESYSNPQKPLVQAVRDLVLAADDRVVYRGDLSTRTFIAFWLRDGSVRAAMNVNVWDVVDDLQALIRSGARIDHERLADVDVPLADHAVPVD